MREPPPACGHAQATRVAGRAASIARSNSSTPSTAWPLTLTITSPRWRPASSAASPGLDAHHHGAPGAARQLERSAIAGVRSRRVMPRLARPLSAAASSAPSSGNVPSVTETVFLLLPRRTESFTLAPGRLGGDVAGEVAAVLDGAPSAATITSSGLIPAFSAGLAGGHVVDHGPLRLRQRRSRPGPRHGLDLDAHPAPDDLPLVAELRQDLLGHVDRDREADARGRGEPLVMIIVLIPITSPRVLSSGPPELPGLMAASVWIMSTAVPRCSCS